MQSKMLDQSLHRGNSYILIPQEITAWQPEGVGMY